MALFANGSEGQYNESRYCRRCVHDWTHRDDDDERECPVLVLHAHWNYDACKDATKHMALDALWPMAEDCLHAAECAMFHAAAEAAEAE
jgi:hypothetical protein